MLPWDNLLTFRSLICVLANLHQERSVLYMNNYCSVSKPCACVQSANGRITCFVVFLSLGLSWGEPKPSRVGLHHLVSWRSVSFRCRSPGMRSSGITSSGGIPVRWQDWFGSQASSWTEQLEKIGSGLKPSRFQVASNVSSGCNQPAPALWGWNIDAAFKTLKGLLQSYVLYYLIWQFLDTPFDNPRP